MFETSGKAHSRNRIVAAYLLRYHREMKRALVVLIVVLTLPVLAGGAALADGWRCDGTTAQTCSDEGCTRRAPSVWVELDFEAKTYGRCDRKGCDRYPVGPVTSSGVFMVIQPRAGTFFKATKDGSQYVEVASLLTTIFITHGRCRPLK